MTDGRKSREREAHSTLCRMCDHGCGIEVTVEAGMPLKIRGNRHHLYNRGWLCAKGRAALELFRSPLRLSQPLVRREGRLMPVGWDEAFATAARELRRLKTTYGPKSLAIYHGEGVGHQEIKYYMKRFAHVYGTPNFMGVGSFCNAARTLGEQLTIGGLTKPDIAATRFLIVWGGNPMVSHEPFTPLALRRLKERGGRVAVVDPRKTETAAAADYHLPVKPGRDEFLLLGMFHVLFRDGLWDQAFATEWVHGLDRFRKIVCEDRFSPEAMEAKTGVGAKRVREVIQGYAETSPACIFTGNGVEHHASGVTAARLLALLKALTGNLDVPGGDLFTPRPRLKDMAAPDPGPKAPPIGADRFPLFYHVRGEAHALCLPEAVLEERPYPIKGMIISGGNPSLEWPASGRVRQALERLEFLLVVDVVQSPDSGYADVVLPACTFLERDEHRVYVYQNLPYVALRREVVAPRFGLEDQMIWVELARHMGYGEHFPWKGCREGIDYLLSGIDLSYDDLLSRGGMCQYEERRYKKYKEHGFNTTTGKVEVEPEPLKRLGYDPFPVRHDMLDAAEIVGEYPLALTTGGNLPCYTHWQYRYIPELREAAPEPLAEIHPETARNHGIAHGDTVEVQSPHGSVRLRANLIEGIRPDTVHIAQGWEEANANELTSADGPDPISGFPNLKSLRCRIRRV